MVRKIKVVPYRSEWPTVFQEERKQIEERITDDNLLNIIHIGSTSVPGLSAKPVIDILLIVKDIEKLDQKDNEFISLDYLPRGEFGISGRRYYAKGGDQRTHQIHAFQFDNLYDIERHILVRDYLRSHDDQRDAYAKIKQEGAKKYPEDIEGYGDHKDLFIKQLEKDAIIWYLTQK